MRQRHKQTMQRVKKKKKKKTEQPRYRAGGQNVF